MTLAQMIEAQRAKVASAITARAAKQDALLALRASDTLTEADVTAAVAERDAADAAVNAERVELERLEGEEAREREIADLAARVAPSGSAQQRVAYDQVARVGNEARTYTRENDPRGAQFERDVASAFLGDYEARDRVMRHQQEERVERPGQIRAAGTGAFAGLVVPQYLTELYAPAAKARRPFADAIRKHPLPSQGMTVNLSRITTATSTAIQTENNAVSETDIDDTLMTINVQTNAGQQTLSRQAIERGAGVEAVTLDDLFRTYHTTLDSTLLNQATNGLTNVATTIAYTDASPTVAELYPKLSQASAAVESALLDMASGDNIAVMHSRRWFWLQQAMISTWPGIGQPGMVMQSLGTNFAEAYGSGVRGVLPNDTPVIVDNNIATNLGAGTNEDEIYVLDRNESHLWEDPNAPMYIRAEQTKAASLGVLMVVYGYFAYTHARYSHAQKLAGTGLVTPTWTGA